MKFIFLRLSRRSIISVSHTNLFTICVLFITRYLTWTMRCHGNGNQRKQRRAKTVLINAPLVGLIIIIA